MYFGEKIWRKIKRKMGHMKDTIGAVPGFNYCGPNLLMNPEDIGKYEPNNYLDWLCMNHDMHYVKLALLFGKTWPYTHPNSADDTLVAKIREGIVQGRIVSKYEKAVAQAIINYFTRKQLVLDGKAEFLDYDIIPEELGFNDWYEEDLASNLQKRLNEDTSEAISYSYKWATPPKNRPVKPKRQVFGGKYVTSNGKTIYFPVANKRKRVVTVDGKVKSL